MRGKPALSGLFTPAPRWAVDLCANRRTRATQPRRVRVECGSFRQRHCTAIIAPAEPAPDKKESPDLRYRERPAILVMQIDFPIGGSFGWWCSRPPRTFAGPGSRAVEVIACPSTLLLDANLETWLQAGVAWPAARSALPLATAGHLRTVRGRSRTLI